VLVLVDEAIDEWTSALERWVFVEETADLDKGVFVVGVQLELVDLQDFTSFGVTADFKCGVTLNVAAGDFDGCWSIANHLKEDGDVASDFVVGFGADGGCAQLEMHALAFGVQFKVGLLKGAQATDDDGGKASGGDDGAQVEDVVESLLCVRVDGFQVNFRDAICKIVEPCP